MLDQVPVPLATPRYPIVVVDDGVDDPVADVPSREGPKSRIIAPRTEATLSASRSRLKLVTMRLYAATNPAAAGLFTPRRNRRMISQLTLVGRTQVSTATRDVRLQASN